MNDEETSFKFQRTNSQLFDKPTSLIDFGSRFNDDN